MINKGKHVNIFKVFTINLLHQHIYLKKNIFIFLLKKNNKFKSQSYNINRTKFIKLQAFYFFLNLTTVGRVLLFLKYLPSFCFINISI